ncbi:MAG: hypothetical protein KF782_31195 [Labilithrix sp.]|nr:hypothetical protein [Labilithrix sp.]
MKRFVSSAVAALALAAPASVLAEAPKRGGDPAAAQALFYEARSLMKSGKHALACPKLEESLRLDYGIGTEYNLADCNEKIGKLSTAWSGFLAVASAAKAHGQTEREKVARARAKALEPRLPKLVIDVASSAPPGLEVTRDGILVGSASWGSPVPVDPGTHRVVAAAPGKEPWEGVVNATEGNVVRVAVPSALAAAAPHEPAPAPLAEREPRRADPPPFPEPIIEQRGSAQRTIGWLVGGLGVAGLGVGAGFGFDSLQKRDRSRDHCAGDLCDREGVALRDRAIRSGDVATVMTVAGATALAGGLVLVLTAPRGPSRTKEVPPTTTLRAVPHVAANGGGISFQGVLP